MSDIPNRLRCKYPIGPIVNGEPEFGWTDFSGTASKDMILPSPIMLEAADRIEMLEKSLAKIACFDKNIDLLWWQIEARNALGDTYDYLQ